MEILDDRWMEFSMLQFRTHALKQGFATSQELKWCKEHGCFYDARVQNLFQFWLSGYMQAMRDEAARLKQTKKHAKLYKLSELYKLV